MNGNTLAKALISGANNITNNQQLVDNLNVFPVPDGDTGTNMSMTINAAKKALEDLIDPTVELVAETTAQALLRGARGNSGVILSLLFRGFAKGLKGKTVCKTIDLTMAFEMGVEAAYKSVMKPTEGTILTVARETALKAKEASKSTNDIAVMFNELTIQAKETLDKTPEMLPVLKKAGVVDAGGKGYLLILEGMLSVIKDDIIIEIEKEQSASFAPPNIFFAEEDIIFTYCTEFIIIKNEEEVDIMPLKETLESLGDSALVVEDEVIIKVHVHTDNPGKALQFGLSFGQLTNIKIENMREQFLQNSEKREKENIYNYEPCEPINQYGFVSVANGHGIQNLFSDLGVDIIVSGGQTMNPSTEDILKAIEATPAKTVFVLPNNKNIVMAAEQTVKLATRRVCVLHTKTIPQGFSAMLAFDPDISVADNTVNMTKSFAKVLTGQITFAARDSEFSGVNVRQGEILAIDNGRISFIEKDISKALYKLIKTMIKKTEGTFITVLYGSDVSETQAKTAHNLLKAKFKDEYEINLINGGQPVYYYLISIE